MGIILNLSFTDKNDAILITDIDPNVLKIQSPTIKIMGNRITIRDSNKDISSGTFLKGDVEMLKLCNKKVMTTDMSLPNVQSFFIEFEYISNEKTI